MLLEQLIPETTPTWLIGITILLGTLGTFWEKIKEIFLNIVEGKQKKELKLLDLDIQKYNDLIKRVAQLEIKNERLMKINIRLSTAMTAMIDEYIKNNPDNVTFIAKIQNLISYNFIDNNENTSTTDNRIST